jgi:hypothetical protein
MPPSGARLTDGFPSKLALTGDPSISLWEKRLKPPGVDAGGPNDTSNMRNSVWRTMSPKKLKTLTALTYAAHYDPKVYGSIVNQCGNNQQLTVTFPNGATLAFWGFIDKFEPGELVEGEPPLANVTVQPTNQDNAGVEQAPVYLAAPTTTTTTSTTPA